MKILVFGKNGQVGSELRRSLAPLGDVVALGRSGAPAMAGDLSDPAQIESTIRSLRPDVIVNAAGYTAVDRAEQEAALSRRINAEAPAVMARSAAATGAWFVHYSSDYVFDGSGSAPWHEDSIALPLNVYGQGKLDADRLIADSGCRHLILRTSWVYGTGGHHFAAAMLRLAREVRSLRVVDDQVGAPTSAALLADVTARALRIALDNPSLSGTYHATAAGTTSRWGYARHVIERARQAGESLVLAEGAIEAVPTSQFPTPAQRPLNSRLDTGKLRRAFGLSLPSWEESVDTWLDRFLTANAANR